MAGIHVARKPDMFRISNGDHIVLFPDRWLGEESSEMKYYRDLNSDLLYELAEDDAPVVNDRVLLLGRIDPEGNLYNGLRTCCYAFDSTTLKPLREIISPTVSYDMQTNTVTLWWWTNFKEDPGDDYTDDPDYLYWIDEDTFQATDYVIRALCCAKASVNTYYILGGAGHSVPIDGNDISLVFSYPTIVDKRVAETAESPSGKGLAIVDFAAGGGEGGTYSRWTPMYSFEPLTAQDNAITITQDYSNILKIRVPIRYRYEGVESGDTDNQLSNYESMNNITEDVLDDDLKMYFKIIDDGGGNFYVEMYKDSAMIATDLVGHTDTYTIETLGDKDIIEDNGSGISGIITVGGVPTATDTIEYQFGLYRYGIVKEYDIVNGYVYIKGAPLDITGVKDISRFEYGPVEAVVDVEMFLPGYYGDVLSLAAFHRATGARFRWNFTKGYLVTYSLIHEHNGITNPYINPLINDNRVSTDNSGNGITADIDWRDNGDVAIDVDYYMVSDTLSVELEVTAISDPLITVDNLTASLIFVVE